MRDLAENDADLYHRLDRLLRLAAAAGEDAEWIDATADQITAMFRELAALRANARDPRRAKTLADAERLNTMLDRSARLGLSRRAAHAAARAQLGVDKYQFARLLSWAERLRNVAQPPWNRLSSPTVEPHK